MAFELKDFNIDSFGLLKLLTKNLNDLLWVKDLEGNYIYANQALCDKFLLAKDINEPIGKNDNFFTLREQKKYKNIPNWHTFGGLCQSSDIDVILNKKPLKIEESANIKGELLILEIYKEPFYNSDGDIIGTIGTARDITDLKKTQEELQKSLKILKEQRKELEYKAHYDLLTSFPNRILFMDRLEQSINLAQRYKRKIAVLSIDLDHFKEINESLGHNIGDKVLLKLSKRLKKEMRISDTLSRLEGDEFGIILNDIDDIENITELLTKKMQILSAPTYIDAHTLYISMSVGISIYPNDGDNAESLLKNAITAMYKAKSDGRNTYSFYDEAMTEKAFERVFLQTALKKALLEDELIVYFQPQIDAKQNRLVGMEALVRWQHPTMGIINPDKFIPLAEATGMIVELDRIVMKKALSQFKEWHNSGLNPGKLSLNLAIMQLEETDFLDFLRKMIGTCKCHYEEIEFELIESQIMQNPKKSITALKKISALGISIAVDDFGTGYSSLSYLKSLPINKLKIDRSFVQDLPYNDEDAAISKTIISLCQNLNLTVIAEGVENEGQKNFMLENGCDFIQGYYYSQPLCIKDMTEFLHRF